MSPTSCGLQRATLSLQHELGLDAGAALGLFEPQCRLTRLASLCFGCSLFGEPSLTLVALALATRVFLACPLLGRRLLSLQLSPLGLLIQPLGLDAA